ncbi:Chitobiosyldiphosphodolichol beta-mannosyltransferase ALG1-like protein [Aduncisulcus paluster]|uniref:Chitobiosyldiphosphodolichol beta-mannosyltransferase ALG1-like protein n=1 Tax=Aduncisulcus paluster TaxID=2918883 RepID=A0ABQ5K1J4_9EUKA|nr:Chitobiosyldiphosphodolichol beta-mannosyltransferase ALG1-like protein [Aduncisulcus paluster]
MYDRPGERFKPLTRGQKQHVMRENLRFLIETPQLFLNSHTLSFIPKKEEETTVTTEPSSSSQVTVLPTPTLPAGFAIDVTPPPSPIRPDTKKVKEEHVGPTPACEIPVVIPFNPIVDTLAICSTSWTPDEDVLHLLDVLEQLDKERCSSESVLAYSKRKPIRPTRLSSDLSSGFVAKEERSSDMFRSSKDGIEKFLSTSDIPRSVGVPSSPSSKRKEGRLSLTFPRSPLSPSILQGSSPSRLFFIFTGKGPLLTPDVVARMLKISSTSGPIVVTTMFLAPTDYPLLIGSCDFGVSPHSSSSGIDLPMKVLDYFGCGLPVVQCRYKAISELVRDGVNGLLYDKSVKAESGGSNSLYACVKKMWQSCDLREDFRRNIVIESEEKGGWQREWLRKMYPLVAGTLGKQ